MTIKQKTGLEIEPFGRQGGWRDITIASTVARISTSHFKREYLSPQTGALIAIIYRH